MANLFGNGLFGYQNQPTTLEALGQLLGVGLSGLMNNRNARDAAKTAQQGVGQENLDKTNAALSTVQGLNNMKMDEGLGGVKLTNEMKQALRNAGMSPSDIPDVASPDWIQQAINNLSNSQQLWSSYVDPDYINTHQLSKDAYSKVGGQKFLNSNEYAAQNNIFNPMGNTNTSVRQITRNQRELDKNKGLLDSTFANYLQNNQPSMQPDTGLIDTSTYGMNPVAKAAVQATLLPYAPTQTQKNPISLDTSTQGLINWYRNNASLF